MKFPSEEPSADVRALATNMRQMFVAFTQAGFTERQALTILTDVIKASIGAMTIQRDE